ncbi:hypothetical protein J4208_03015 [Candidatus Woesearchaeota archaeon]|nr:hypothetical protein [Candidatus Woesearchaeota archaeon]
MSQEDIQKQIEFQKQIQVLETTVKQYLTKEAITRYGNIKAAHQQKAIQIITILAQLIQSGQITEKIDDAQFKEILLKMQEPQQKTKITWK